MCVGCAPARAKWILLLLLLPLMLWDTSAYPKREMYNAKLMRFSHSHIIVIVVVDSSTAYTFRLFYYANASSELLFILCRNGSADLVHIYRYNTRKYVLKRTQSHTYVWCACRHTREEYGHITWCKRSLSVMRLQSKKGAPHTQAHTQIGSDKRSNLLWTTK